MSNPIIPRTNSAPGSGAPSWLYLGEIASNRSTGKLYLGADSGVVEVSGGGGGATTFSELSGTLQTSQLCALSGDVTALSGTAVTYLSKIQGNPLSAASPLDGQTLQWNGSAWVPGAIPSGGNGGGGLLYYLNFGTAASAPTTGLPTTPVVPHELGRVADSGLTTLTSGTLSTSAYDLVCGFVSDPLDPDVNAIPAGLWDFNLFASSNANQSNQTIVQVRVYKYDGTSPTLIATSGDVSIYDPTVTAEYSVSVVIPQTSISLSDRIYIELRAKATGNNHTVTFSFGDSYPSHLHSTLPSIGGSGLVKVINGVMQSPASLLINGDIDENAEISLSKLAQSSATTSQVLGWSLSGWGPKTLTTADIASFSSAAASAAPVQSVAGRTGAVTLTTADIAGYSAGGVTSVAGKTGVVTLTTADIGGLQNAVYSTTTGLTGATSLANIIQITQAGYNALTPQTNTLYIIVG
jgi:hypothetical protein